MVPNCRTNVHDDGILCVELIMIAFYLENDVSALAGFDRNLASYLALSNGLN